MNLVIDTIDFTKLHYKPLSIYSRTFESWRPSGLCFYATKLFSPQSREDAKLLY